MRLLRSCGCAALWMWLRVVGCELATHSLCFVELLSRSGRRQETDRRTAAFSWTRRLTRGGRLTHAQH